MKKVLLSAIVFLTSVMIASAQVNEPKETPQLEFAMQLKVTLGESYGINNTQHGRRTVIPITGGTFEGPGIKGTIIIRFSILLCNNNDWHLLCCL